MLWSFQNKIRIHWKMSALLQPQGCDCPGLIPALPEPSLAPGPFLERNRLLQSRAPFPWISRGLGSSSLWEWSGWHFVKVSMPSFPPNAPSSPVPWQFEKLKERKMHQTGDEGSAGFPPCFTLNIQMTSYDDYGLFTCWGKYWRTPPNVLSFALF